MALKTTLEQLEEVQGAISDQMSAIASYTIGDVKVSRSDASKLEALHTRERYLKAMYQRERGGRGRIRLNLSGGV
jgi:hypothetical protein